MELIKKNIHMDRIRTEAVMQITLEEDMNIPDSRPDADSISLEKGSIVIEEIKPGTDVVNIKGKLQYYVLYHTMDEGCGLVPLEGKIEFDERLNLQKVTGTDCISADGVLEDLSIGMINSRKLSIQCVATLRARVEELYDEETPIGIYGEERLEYRQVPMNITQIAISKNDIFRVKEEVNLPSSYPNIFQILWNTISLRDMEFKIMEEKITLQGDVHFFLLYEGEGEDHPVRSFETIIPISGNLECHGCKEGMFPDIRGVLGQQEITVRPDLDGEERMIGLELVLDIAVRIYEEEQVEILTDIYGVKNEVETLSDKTNLRRLLSKVTGKTKVTEHIKIGNGNAAILQLVHSEGNVVLDHQKVVENGILLEGVLQVKVMYITGNDEMPYASTQAQLPYQYMLDVPEIKSEDLGNVKAELEQLQVTMLDGEEMDVKAVITFTTTVFQSIPISLIHQIKVTEMDSTKLNNLPSMAIYIVKAGDNLWNIGKKYYVSVNDLRELNTLATDELQPGQKLLIVKA